MNFPVRVVVGILRRADGKLLVGRRRDDTHQGGKWEFPGGKLLPGETAGAALKRELAEELGVEVVASRSLVSLKHCYPDRLVSLEACEVGRWRGEPEGKEGQEIRWVEPMQLSRLDFPDANKTIVSSLSCPRLGLRLPESCDDSSLPAIRQLIRTRALIIVPSELLRRHRSLWPVIQDSRADGSWYFLSGGKEGLSEFAVDGLHVCGREIKDFGNSSLAPEGMLSVQCRDLAEFEAATKARADLVILERGFRLSGRALSGYVGVKRGLVFSAAIDESTYRAARAAGCHGAFLPYPFAGTLSNPRERYLNVPRVLRAE